MKHPVMCFCDDCIKSMHQCKKFMEGRRQMRIAT